LDNTGPQSAPARIADVALCIPGFTVLVKKTFRYTSVFFYNHLYRPEGFYEKRYNNRTGKGGVMKGTVRSMEKIIEEQMHRWRLLHTQKKAEKKVLPVVTISREPGSGGRIIAQKLAAKLNVEVFHQEVLHEMARRAEVSEQMLATMDQRGLSILEDWISSLVYDRHMWPDEYLKHLMNVIGTIGKHGGAVVVGRGANFILPPEQRFRVRITAPQRFRIRKVAHEFTLSEDDARRRVIKTESDRKAFIRKYFNADIADPDNYDLTINTKNLGVDPAADLIAAALGCVVECEL
jgi:cytidylate kinase